MNRRHAVITACCILAFGASACSGTPTQTSSTTGSNTTAQSHTSVQAGSGEEATENLTIIDVRTPEEYAEGHLDGAVNIDIYAADFAKQIKALDPAGSYAVYCRSGSRSSQAVALMESEGFMSVTDLGSREAASEALSIPIVQ